MVPTSSVPSLASPAGTTPSFGFATRADAATARVIAITTLDATRATMSSARRWTTRRAVGHTNAAYARGLRATRT